MKIRMRALVVRWAFYRAVIFGFAICALSSSAIAGSWELPPQLSDAEIKAFAKKFAEEEHDFGQTAGFDAAPEFIYRTSGLRTRSVDGVFQFIQPVGMSDEEFKQRKCARQLAFGRIYPQGQNTKIFQLIRKNFTLSAIRAPDGMKQVNEIIECGANIDNPDSRFIADALSWAQELENADPAALRRLESQHNEMTNGIFYNVTAADARRMITSEHRAEQGLHLALAVTIGILASEKERKLAEIAAKAEKPPIKVEREPIPSPNVWFRAMPGDVDAQMEMAATYETGSIDFRSNYRAYYWYHTAWKNGAGAAALEGANRTRATLTEADKMLIDRLFKTGQPPSLY